MPPQDTRDGRNPALTRLRTAMLAAGASAESPATLDAEGERMAREERWS